jgi:peptidyl-prolyl cis-trans isomerase C
VETPFGYHIIKVTDKHPQTVAPYSEISDSLKKYLQQKQSKEKLQALLAELRSGAKVEIF